MKLTRKMNLHIQHRFTCSRLPRAKCRVLQRTFTSDVKSGVCAVNPFKRQLLPQISIIVEYGLLIFKAQNGYFLQKNTTV